MDTERETIRRDLAQLVARLLEDYELLDELCGRADLGGDLRAEVSRLHYAVARAGQMARHIHDEETLWT